MHFDDCPSFGPNPDFSKECDCKFRFRVVQVKLDGTLFEWGLSTAGDGGRLAQNAANHPETQAVHVRDRLDGGLHYEIKMKPKAS